MDESDSSTERLRQRLTAQVAAEEAARNAVRQKVELLSQRSKPRAEWQHDATARVTLDLTPLELEMLQRALGNARRLGWLEQRVERFESWLARLREALVGGSPRAVLRDFGLTATKRSRADERKVRMAADYCRLIASQSPLPSAVVFSPAGLEKRPTDGVPLVDLVPHDDWEPDGQDPAAAVRIVRRWYDISTDEATYYQLRDAKEVAIYRVRDRMRKAGRDAEDIALLLPRADFTLPDPNRL